ncbi:MAG TPA: hypothetical protein VIH35_03340 [Kiritimatiellia bacterium]|jgi:hypothetical protein
MHHIARRISILPILAVLVGALPARAHDAGPPIMKTALGKRFNVEVYFEKYQRDIEQEFASGTDTAEQEEDRLLARLTFAPADFASLYLEGGATDSKDSEGEAPLFGGGVRLRAYSTPAVQVDVFGSVTYVDGIEYHVDGFVEPETAGSFTVDHPDLDQTESYYEYEGGILLSHVFQAGPKWTVTPYGGFLFSVLDGDEEYDLTPHVPIPPFTIEGDLKENGNFILAAGLLGTLNKTFGLRLEGRFVDEQSVSAGVSYFF